MVKITVDQGSMQRLTAIVKQMGGSIRKEASVAINKTAKKVKIQSARALNKAIPVNVSILKKLIRVKRLAEPDSGYAVIELKYGYPIPLKYFQAKQMKSKKGGVTFRLARADKNRQIRRDLFIIDQYKGHVFSRKGKERGPLIRMNGPAPGELYDSAGVIKVAVDTATEELPKQMNERIRFLTLKASGQLRGKQKG
jgi:Prophage minor tail protein Z (GPZ)